MDTKIQKRHLGNSNLEVLVVSLPDKLPHLYRPFSRHPHKINPARQGADVKLGFRFGDLASDEVLTADVQDGELSCILRFDGYEEYFQLFKQDRKLK